MFKSVGNFWIPKPKRWINKIGKTKKNENTIVETKSRNKKLGAASSCYEVFTHTQIYKTLCCLFRLHPLALTLFKCTFSISKFFLFLFFVYLCVSLQIIPCASPTRGHLPWGSKPFRLFETIHLKCFFFICKASNSKNGCFVRKKKIIW